MKDISIAVHTLSASWNYYVTAFLFFVGLYIILASPNLMKKLIGLSIFQTAVIIFYVALAKIPGGTAPIIKHMDSKILPKFDNPIPHVLMLTAIVVGVATTAVGLALMLRIYQEYGTIEADEIDELVNNENLDAFIPYDEVEETKEDIKERLFKEYQDQKMREAKDINHVENINDGFDGGFRADPDIDLINNEILNETGVDVSTLEDKENPKDSKESSSTNANYIDSQNNTGDK